MNRIVPENRLLVVYGISLVPLALLSALYPSTALFCWTLVLAAGALFIADGILALTRFQGIDVRLPILFRLSRNRRAHLPLVIRNLEEKPRRLTVGIRFPDQWLSGQTERQIHIDTKKYTRVEWPLSGIRQGRLVVKTIYLETPSRLGFWAIRKQYDTDCEIRIYPDMFSESRSLAALFHKMNMGAHADRQLGKGKEFEKLREYMPGDSYEDIHWKATARRGTPISKVFQIEKTQDVYVFIDNSRLSARNISQLNPGSENEAEPTGTQTTILEQYISTALAIGMAAERLGDHFGLGVFSDRMDTFLPAGSGRSRFNACRDLLYILEHKPVSPDFTELITFAGNKIRRRALMILLTNLDDPAMAEGFVRHTHILSRRHVVLVNTIRPDAARPVFSDPDIHGVDEIYQALSGHMLWHDLKELEQSLRRMGIGFLASRAGNLSWDLISSYLRIKQRQML